MARRSWAWWVVCVLAGHRRYETGKVRPRLACRRCPRTWAAMPRGGGSIYPPPKEG